MQFLVKNCRTLSIVWAGALINYPSQNRQTCRVFQKNSRSQTQPLTRPAGTQIQMGSQNTHLVGKACTTSGPPSRREFQLLGVLPHKGQRLRYWHEYPLVPVTVRKDILCLLGWFGTFIKNRMHVWVHFCAERLRQSVCWPRVRAGTTLSTRWCQDLKSCSDKSSKFLKVVLGCLGPFYFHIHFGIILPISTKNSVIPIGIACIVTIIGGKLHFINIACCNPSTRHIQSSVVFSVRVSHVLRHLFNFVHSVHMEALKSRVARCPLPSQHRGVPP